ncbi:hypothetical protein HYH03_011152 [Edaphochlamys debaryana]|uniref:Uncharacterized protein n=1 Tax=Edaphochlamys debaryana TaxID=47281 RepID=A0A835XV42_9CHLO|nr:hypothetical protein HYH03_011152 [Edaphochlamys debaryana]|eukprot:KAG2490350.1 hypothetical protein HYH03_011152 [Edaphochlamys debaryana]
MFGFGKRGKDQDFKKLQEDLQEEKQRNENLASVNRALAAKVHRLALQREELRNDRDKLTRENRELVVSNLTLSTEAKVARDANADAWEVPKLKAALRAQAAQHESKIKTLKRRTKALLTAVIPGASSGPRGASSSAGGAGASTPAAARLSTRSMPGSPGDDLAEEELWDMPLSPSSSAELPSALPDPAPSASASEVDVNDRVRQIISCLYDDTLSEDQALEQMTELTQGLQALTLPSSAAAGGASAVQSRGCSPLVPRLGLARAGSGAGGPASEMVDAATDPPLHSARGRFGLVDAATETPAEMSYLGSPRDTASATPAESATPKRMGLGLGGAGVPPLDLAALVAQAMESAPLSNRSSASTTAGSMAGAASFNAFSHFVLAQPEKLQRLIMRHAAATRPGLQLQQGPASSAGTGTGASPFAASGARTDSMPFAASGSASGSGGSFTARTANALTARLLGLGASSSAANVQRQTNPAPSVNPSTAQQPAVGGGTAGVLLPAAASPSKGAGGKRIGPSVPPKFVSGSLLEGPGSTAVGPSAAKAPAQGPSFVPAVSFPGLMGAKEASPELKPLWGRAAGSAVGGVDLDAAFGDLLPGSGSSGQLAVRR